MGFQKTVNINPAQGVAGDFASNNPIFSLVAGEGQLKAGEDGVKVGVFAFADLATGLVSNKHTEGARCGFVPRAQNLAIIGYSAEASLVIPKGREITLIASGDFFAEVEGGNVGDAIVASKADGTLKAVADASAEADGVDTGFTLASVPVGGLAKITKLG